MLDLFKELFGETVAEKLFIVPTTDDELVCQQCKEYDHDDCEDDE